jgi:hypothetical protein
MSTRPLRALGAAVLLAAGCGGDGAPAVTFDDVAPLFEEHCTQCHQEGGIAPFVLTDFESAAEMAPRIEDEVVSRRMPPWGVDHGADCNSYGGARWLDDAEIATIVAWVGGGARRGARDTAAATPPPHLAGATHEVAMDAPYEPSIALDDDYRCFVLDPALAEDGYLTAYEVLPGEPRIVHHVILFGVISDEGDAEARALDDDEDGPGYRCFGGPEVSFGDVRFLAGWAPGTGATVYPEGTGIRMRAGHLVVMQVHYHRTPLPLTDLTRIALRIEPTVAEPSEVLPMADLEMVLPPGLEAAEGSSTVTFDDDVVPRIYGVYPHMHRRGRTLRVERERAGATTCVVDVPRWDFDWQQFYFYEEPLDARRGDVFRLRCTFDTTMDREPVRWGEGTEDEMCLAGFYFSPPLLDD